VLAAYLGPADFGGQFNGGTINNGANAITLTIHSPGYNNFLAVTVHAGGTLTLNVLTLEPFTEAVLFTDPAGGGVAAGTNRFNLFATAGTRSGDPIFRWQIQLAATVANLTGVNLRLFCSNR
jgi:hypothetical protein